VIRIGFPPSVRLATWWFFITHHGSAQAPPPAWKPRTMSSARTWSARAASTQRASFRGVKNARPNRWLAE
jgi:hypothetical protein